MTGSKVFVPVRPDSTRWSRSFTSSVAAWRAVVGECNSAREARQRRAQLERDGWTVVGQCKSSSSTMSVTVQDRSPSSST